MMKVWVLDDLRGTWRVRPAGSSSFSRSAAPDMAWLVLPSLREALMSRYEGGLILSVEIVMGSDPFGRTIPRADAVMLVRPPRGLCPDARIRAHATVRAGVVVCRSSLEVTSSSPMLVYGTPRLIRDARWRPAETYIRYPAVFEPYEVGS